MKSRILLNGLAVFLFLLLLSGYAWSDTAIYPETVIVITDDSKPIKIDTNTRRLLYANDISVEVLNLDAVNKFERDISKDLPFIKSEAKRIFELRIESIGKEKFKMETLIAYEGILKALRYKIDRYPAILFDEKLVVFGVTDFDIALDEFKEWQINNRKKDNE